MEAFEYILVDPQHRPQVALIQINRPQALNALNLDLMQEIKRALMALDDDQEVRCIVITGNEKAFAAGADIKQMSGKGAVEMLQIDQFSTWDQIRKTKKPIIAAVSGFALGGGCELCMLCDMIVASETARFGQPEIHIGIMPGAGGTQRLTRAVGKTRAMEMVLTGELINAEEALRYGLINKIVPVELYLEEALRLAHTIAQRAPISVQLAKESINNAYENHLQEGLLLERKNFYTLFATQDQKEGMNAFVEKRTPDFKGK